jgi:general secretion pathway protein C
MNISIKRYLTVLNFLLVGGIVYFSVNAFYGIMATRLDPGQPDLSDRSKVSVPLKENLPPLSHYDAISDRNLFKTNAKSDIKASAINVDTLKQTDLNLKLWGTVTGLKDQTYAVIEESKTRKQNLYRVGDTIQNATVKLVLREKVVLNVDGKDEVLEIEKVKSRARYTPAVQPDRRSRKIRPQRITLRRAQIENALEDVNKLLTQVNIRPHYTDGKPDGLLLTRIRPRSIFLRMGLRNGDIITGVNESPLQSVDDALKFYESLRSADNVTLQLKRRGRSRTIDYKIK